MLFEAFSIDSNGLNPEKFEKICPAIVEQIESRACLLTTSDKEKKAAVKQSKTQGKGWFWRVNIKLFSCRDGAALHIGCSNLYVCPRMPITECSKAKPKQIM